MKTAIIYASKTGTTRKVAKALADKIKGEVKTIPIARAESTCLLKYDFVIIAGSIHYGHIQGDLKRFVHRNAKTLKEKNYGLYIMCMFEDKADEYLRKEFSQEIVDSAFITACFGGEVNPNEGNFITKKLIKANLKQFEEEGKEPPSIRWELVDEYADKINDKMKR